ncbi:MAG: tetratricopeptide repeat protein [Parcubacteria group bacterium]|nr:tetratricopeptide repeat protein [Parcubacteria group bacterium]
MSRKTLYFVAVFTIFIGFVGLFIYFGTKKEEPVLTQSDVPVAGVGQGGTIEIPKVVVDTTAGGSATGAASDHVALPVPNLDRPVNIPQQLVRKDEIASQIKDISARLSQDASLFNDWMDLGLLRKSIEDYDGALEAWEYASALRPQNSLSFSNLGVLYAYYLNDQARAEANFLRAVENNPGLDYLYPQVVDFYLEVVRSEEKARAFLNRSMVARPDSEVIKTLLKNLGV